jgi:hypothetical protein
MAIYTQHATLYRVAQVFTVCFGFRLLLSLPIASLASLLRQSLLESVQQ